MYIYIYMHVILWWLNIPCFLKKNSLYIYLSLPSVVNIQKNPNHIVDVICIYIYMYVYIYIYTYMYMYRLIWIYIYILYQLYEYWIFGQYHTYLFLICSSRSQAVEDVDQDGHGPARVRVWRTMEEIGPGTREMWAKHWGKTWEK